MKKIVKTTVKLIGAFIETDDELIGIIRMLVGIALFLAALKLFFLFAAFLGIFL